MGWPEVAENGRKIKKNLVSHGGRRRRFADPIRARLEAVGRETSRTASSGCPLPPWKARVASGWPKVPPSIQSSTTRKWLNDPTCVPGLESFFLGFWSSRGCFGG